MKRTHPAFDVTKMEVGVIYRDYNYKPYMLQFCEICGKPRAVTMIGGKPIATRCHLCSERTPEKRAIMSKAHKGIPFSAETIRKRIEAYSSPENYHNNLDYKARIAEKIRIRGTSEETRRKLSIANKGQVPSERCLNAQKAKIKELFSNKEWKSRQIELMRIARENSPIETELKRRDKISKATKERWSNPKYREETIAKLMKSLGRRPTRPELALNNLLQEQYPKQWIYNGNYSHNVIIGGLVPDFVNVNGKKQVIEMFGEHYHRTNSHIKVSLLRTEEGRIAKFKEFGFNCLIVWGNEMLKNPELVKHKLAEFIGAK